MRARRSGEELQATMAAVSHDIRTPLAAACGYLELLRGESDPVRQEGGLAVIAAGCRNWKRCLTNCSCIRA